jgi:hypothetical protein
MADAEQVYRAHPTDVTAEITPRRWRSWTGSVLHEETRKELTGSYEDAWLTGDE